MAVLTAQQYRERRSPRDYVTLSNGDQCEVRPVDTLQLAFQQQLDADRVDDIMALMRAAGEDGKLAILRERSDQVASFIDVIVAEGTVSPKVVLHKQRSDSDVLGIDELDLVDKLALLGGITRATERKAALLREQTAGLAPA